jgi:hypothetical protein
MTPMAIGPEDALAAREMIEHLVALAREKQDEAKLAMALHAQGHSLLLSGDHALAEQAFTESRELSQKLGDVRRAAITRGMLGIIPVVQGQLEDGLPRIVKALADLAPDDPARAVLAAQVAKLVSGIDADRLEAALAAATRDHPALSEELTKAFAAGRPKA